MARNPRINPTIDSTPQNKPPSEQASEAIAMLAPGLRPQWASTSAAPLSITRWRARNWSVPLLGAIAVERTTVLRLDYRVIQQLAAKHPAWGEVHSAFLWTYVDGLFSITTSVRNGSVEDRYRNLLVQRPSLMRRVSQREIASYLSITESALSRIAKRVRDTDLEPEPEPEPA